MTDADAAHSRYVPGSLAPPLVTKWEVSFPAVGQKIVFSIVANGKMLYVINGNGNRGSNGSITAVDLASGKVRWTLTDRTRLLAPGIHFVAMSDGLIGPDSKEHLTKWSVVDGKPLWITPLKWSLGADLLSNGHLFTAEVREDSGQYGGRLLEIDPANGHILADRTVDTANTPNIIGRITFDWFGQMPGKDGWLFVSGLNAVLTLEQGLGSVHGVFYGAGYVAADSNQLFLLRSDRVSSFRRSTAPLWRVDCKLYPFPPYVGSTGLVVTPSQVIACYPKQRFGLNRATGKIVWKHNIGTEDFTDYQIPVAVGQTLYAVTAGKGSKVTDQLTAYHLPDGHSLWSKRFQGELTQMIVHKGALYVVRKDPASNQLYLMKLLPKSMAR